MRERKSPLALFAADRFIYMISFVTAVIVLVLIVALAAGGSNRGLAPADIGYMLIMSIFFLAVAMGNDYTRRRAFLHQLERIIREELEDGAVTLPEPQTGEHALVREALLLQHKQYEDRLIEHRRQAERHYEFVTQWVHQMKTPVSVIELLTEPGSSTLAEGSSVRGPGGHDAERDIAAPGVKALLESIREENARLVSGLDTVLHLARLDKLETDVRIERLSLLPLLRTAVNAHKKALIRHSIFPAVEGDDAQVESDAKWLSFIVHQVMTNSIKYSRTMPGSKRLLLQVEPAPDGTVLRIRDEGIGIPAADLPRVTEPFFTGENGRTHGESSGMGLYLAKEACGRLGHPLAIDSVVGEGTTVTIRFVRRTLHDTRSAST